MPLTLSAMLRSLFTRLLLPALALALLLPAARGAAITGLGAAFATAPELSGVKAELVAAETSVQPGRAFTVALRLEHAEHWHTYWVNPGIGLPTKLTWDLPPGWTAGEIQWPTPVKILDTHGVITGNGYEGTVYLPVTLTPPSGLKPGETVTLKAKAEWLMCWPQDCVPGEAQLVLTLPVRATIPEVINSIVGFYTVQGLPHDTSGWEMQAAQTGKTIFLRLTRPVGTNLPAPLAPWFFSDNGFVQYDKPQVFREDKPGVYIFELPLSQSANADNKRLTGVLRTEGNWVDGESERRMVSGLKIDVPFGDATALGLRVARTTPDTLVSGLLGTLAFAFLGGLILNLMPCVFPVLGIKILGFVHQAGADRRKVVRHGLVFTAGVLLSFWALAGALAVLRHGGEELGWGFQLQSPAFVFSLAVVMLVFALNLSGVFEFGLAATGVGGGWQTKTGYAGSFFTGVLATIVATPCSAPFLAPALGAALALPTGQSFLVFTTIALGLSTPYLALSIFPGAVKWLPRPGAWMETFKQFMAFPLYATVGALVWVLVGQVGEVAQRNVILGLTVVALGVWCYGRFVAAGSRPGRARFGVVAGVALFAAGAWFGWPQAPAADDLVWEPWSTARVTQLRADGRTIYVDFTARWCATCQTNEATVFSSAEVTRLVRDKKVALLKADWTKRDALITAELARWGRAAVPLNLVYRPGEAEPKVLPGVLTPGVVIEALGK